MASNDDNENVNVLKPEKIVNLGFEKRYSTQQKFFAEFLGTSFLVFVVTGIPLFAVIKKN